MTGHSSVFSQGHEICITSVQLQWSLSKTATCGPVLTELYREVAALQR